MLFLAIDTATAMSTVALSDGTRVIASQSEIVGTRHAEVTIQQIAAITPARRSELSHVVVGVGPGPYTSTRVGVAMAVAMAHALDIPVHGICTLDAIAVGAARVNPSGDGNSDFAVATDARRRELYWATYRRQDGTVTRTSGPLVGYPATLIEQFSGVGDTRGQPSRHQPRWWAGDGWSRYGELVNEHQIELIEPLFPDAGDLAAHAFAALTRGDPVAQRGVELDVPVELDVHGGDGAGAVPPGTTLLPPVPLYLRRPDAQERKKVAGRFL